MRVLAVAMGYEFMRADERQQASVVEAVIGAVERTLIQQKTVREGIREGRIRVDKLVDDALDVAAHRREDEGTR